MLSLRFPSVSLARKELALIIFSAILLLGCLPTPASPTPTPPPPTATPQKLATSTPGPLTFVLPPAVTPFAIDKYGEPETDAATQLLDCHPALPILEEYLTMLQEVEVQYAQGDQPGFTYAGLSSGKTIVVWTDVAHPCEVILHEVMHSLQSLNRLDVSDFPVENPDFAAAYSTRYQDNPTEAYAFYGEFAICGNYSCLGASGENVCDIEGDLRSYYPWFDYSSCS